MMPKTFPFKTLIIASSIITLSFMFKNELSFLLFNTRELTIGTDKITIKTTEQGAKKLEQAEKEFKEIIAELNSRIKEQSQTIESINSLKSLIEDELADCPENESAKLMLTDVKQFRIINEEIKLKTLTLEKLNPIFSIN